MSFQWITRGFEAFRRGSFGNGGQNIYVSRQGVLQRIHQTDVTGNGYLDLIVCNSQNHEELTPLAVYSDPLNHPELKREIWIGGATDGVVADLTGDGTQSMVWACTWDGMSWLNNSAICYGSADGPSERYINYLPATVAKAVAAGDFNGDGRCDLVFYCVSAGVLKFFYQDELGFCAQHISTLPAKNVKSLAAYRFENDPCDSLLLRRCDGSITMLRKFDGSTPEIPLFGPEPDYREVVHDWNNYTQAVEETPPKLQIVRIDDRPYLSVIRKQCVLLCPFTAEGIGKPVKIDCAGALAVAAGDIFGRGTTDLLIAAREKVGNREYSYIYPGGPNGYSNADRLAIPTYRASDAALGKFSGGAGLDVVIAQSHTFESYDNDILVLPTGLCKSPQIPKAKLIPAHDAARVLVVQDSAGRDHLVIGNCRSGSFIGNPDNYVYIGSASGFHEHDRLELPGWGSVDAVCADLRDSGRPDLVFANASELSPWLDPGSYVYYRRPDGGFDRLPQCLKTVRAHGVVCGDLNHNGYLDLAFVGFDNPELTIFYGSAEGFSEANAVRIRMEIDGHELRQPRFLSLADLNGDGYLDLIISMIDAEESYVLWGGPEGFSFERRQAFKVHNACNSKVADLNGDGYPELIWGGHSPTPGQPRDSFVYIYWGGPDGFSESRRSMLPSMAVNSISVADFNGDGLLDIFIGSYQNGHERDIPSYIYWNSPDGFHANARTLFATHAVSGSVAADFNDDGLIDLAVGNHKVDGCHISYSTVWYNSPTGFSADRTVNLPSKGVHGMGNVDPGNVLDRSFDEYYDSSVHEIPSGCGIAGIFWDAEIPHRSGVFAQFRCAESKEELAQSAWRGPLGPHSRFGAHDRVEKQLFTGCFMQYRLILYSHNALNTPRVREVTVEFAKIPNGQQQ